MAAAIMNADNTLMLCITLTDQAYRSQTAPSFFSLSFSPHPPYSNQHCTNRDEKNISGLMAHILETKKKLSVQDLLLVSFLMAPLRLNYTEKSIK